LILALACKPKAKIMRDAILTPADFATADRANKDVLNDQGDASNRVYWELPMVILAIVAMILAMTMGARPQQGVKASEMTSAVTSAVTSEAAGRVRMVNELPISSEFSSPNVAPMPDVALSDNLTRNSSREELVGAITSQAAITPWRNARDSTPRKTSLLARVNDI
jgi:hypothetical protein